MVIDAGRIKHLGDLMHKSYASNGSAVASNWRLSADGLANVVWTPESAGSAVSYASNSNEVSYNNAPGASSLVSRADHVHRGVTSVSHTSNTFNGPVILTASGSLGITVPTPGTFNLSATAGTSGGGGSGALTFLAQTALGADTANITITGISGSYKDLVIVVLARTDQANDDSFLNLLVGNGSIDTGANYGYATALGPAGTASVSYGANSGLSLVQAGICAGTNATAGAFGMTLVEIVNYASTSQFRMMRVSAGKVGATAYYEYDGMGAWRNAASAIDQVRVQPAAGNLKTGSQMTIYGRG